MIYYNGSSWSEVVGPESSQLNDAWMASSSDIYINSGKKVYHFDGIIWTTLYEHVARWLRCIWGSSTSDIYLTAYKGILHFDGASWELDSLDVGSSTTRIWGSSASDIFAVGYNGLILHNDGTGWTEMDSPTNASLFEIWGSSHDDVYAAGVTVVLHFDGLNWSHVSPTPPVSSIRALWGTANDDVFISHGFGEILHFNGQEWQEMNSNTSMPLYGMWGAAPDDIYAVGSNEKIIHFDGNEWSSISGGLPRYSEFVCGLNRNNIYLGSSSAVFRYDGSHFEELPNVLGRLQSFDVWGTSPSHLISVGANGKVFHYDGIRWDRADVPTDRTLRAVFGVGADAVWAVGDGKMCIYYDGNQWIALYEDIGSNETFNDVWAASRNSVFIVGSSGTLARFGGGVWTFFNSGTNQNLQRVWGTSPSNVYAVGDGGAILHFNGRKWEPMTYPNYSKASSFIAISGTGPTDVFALNGFDIYHFNGTVWSAVSNTGLGDIFADIWACPTGEVFATTAGTPPLYMYKR
ncbi:MAG: hypothetical protein GTN50_09075 [Candidatus Latescibacteria bacterium]|nr:hypothetical protein [Candidatus Latescibacterota bacterium]